MLTDKKITSLIRRIKKDNSSYGTMGAMILLYEFEAMSQSELEQLGVALVLKNINSPTFNQVYSMSKAFGVA